MIQFHGIYPIKGLVLKSQPCAKNTALTQNSATFRPYPGHMQEETLVIAVANNNNINTSLLVSGLRDTRK